MAGDWIRVRCDIHDDPAVIAIAGKLEISEDAVVGKVLRLWSWASRQLRNGNASGVTGKWVDRYLGAAGAAEALVAVGWLELSDEGLGIPNFERYLSEGAKQRGLTARRVAKRRATKCNAGGVTSSLPEKMMMSSSSSGHPSEDEDKRGNAEVTAGALQGEAPREVDGGAIQGLLDMGLGYGKAQLYVERGMSGEDVGAWREYAERKGPRLACHWMKTCVRPGDIPEDPPEGARLAKEVDDVIRGG